MKNAFYLLLLLLLGTLVTGCTTKYIPKTTIEDTEENRQLVTVMENYRTSMESLDPNRLLELAAPNYYDTSGTPMPDDDVDLTGLKEFFQNHFSKIKALRLALRVEKVVPDEEEEWVVGPEGDRLFRLRHGGSDHDDGRSGRRLGPLLVHRHEGLMKDFRDEKPLTR